MFLIERKFILVVELSNTLETNRMEHESDFFAAPKPFLEREETRKGNLPVTVFSILLFSSLFLFVSDNNIDLLIQLLIVLIIHELGHYLGMKYFNFENVRMLFVPLMGAFVHGTKQKYSQIQNLIITLAGPVPGIIIGSLLWFYGLESSSTWIIELSLLFFIINISNLIPLSPLDGGRLMTTLFLKHAEIVHLCLLSLFSFGILLFSFWTNSFFSFAIGIVTFLQVRGLYRRYKLHQELKTNSINYETTYEELTDGAYQRIKKIVLERSPALRKYVEEIDDEDTTTIVATEVSNVLISPVEKNATFGLKVLIVLLWIAAISLPFVLVLNHLSLVEKIYEI